MSKYMQAHTKEYFDYANTWLKEHGYEWVGVREPTFEEVKRCYHGNSKPYLKGFWNGITKRMEIEATTKTVEKSYGINI